MEDGIFPPILSPMLTIVGMEAITLIKELDNAKQELQKTINLLLSIDKKSQECLGMILGFKQREIL